MKKPLEIILHTLHLGSCRRVTALEIDGKCPSQSFIADLQQSNVPGYDSLFARIRAVAERETFCNPQTFKSLGEGLFEFKTRKTGTRLYAFYDEIEGLEPQLIIATNGGKKNSKKEQNRDISKARQLMNRYLKAKQIESTILRIRKEQNENPNRK